MGPVQVTPAHRTKKSHWIMVAAGLLAAAATVEASAASPQRSQVRPALRKQIHSAIDRGLTYLVAGRIGSRDPRTEAHNTDGLALYAALHSGGGRSEPAIASALEALARKSQGGTYVAACAVMALSAGGEREYRGPIQKLASQLVRTQQRGAWGYPSGEDLSNTQYAALGLWAAHRAGADVPRNVWLDLAKALPEFTGPEGGFSYTRHKGGATMSMTAAGVACAALCREMLLEEDDSRRRRGDTASAELLLELDLMEARSLEWMADRFAESGTEKGHYALYGIERAAALSHTERFGEHDWYARGALYLVGTQEPTGEWKGAYGDVATTCFSLLFLARATSKVTSAPVSGPVATVKEPDGATLTRQDLELLHRRDLGRNRTTAAGARARSSSRSSRRGAEFVLDQRRATFWESSDHDDAPTLRLTFDSPRSIDTILVAHPWEEGMAQDVPVRLAMVQVTVNGGATYSLPMPADPGRKGRLELPRPVELETLSIVCVRPEGAERAAVGEVEIQTRPR